MRVANEIFRRRRALCFFTHTDIRLLIMHAQPVGALEASSRNFVVSRPF